MLLLKLLSWWKENNFFRIFFIHQEWKSLCPPDSKYFIGEKAAFSYMFRMYPYYKKKGYIAQVL